jgi:arylsulfatase A-like enzyme
VTRIAAGDPTTVAEVLRWAELDTLAAVAAALGALTSAVAGLRTWVLAGRLRRDLTGARYDQGPEADNRKEHVLASTEARHHGKPGHPHGGHSKPPPCGPPEGGVTLPEGAGEPEQGPILPDEPDGAPGRAKPNMLVIFGDDIGQWNISAYNRGAMGYRTPNIDRIAAGGVLFTDAYADQSCTAGRGAFITGQSGIRTGLTRVGLPGDLFGISLNDPTLATLLKGEGYATGQFGKNHLGDRDFHLPTVHGFDAFEGNLYHLNAEEEPEHPDFPADPRYPRPRGVLHCRNTGFLRQEVHDTGPLTKKRMETIDNEFLEAATRWIRERHATGEPWFCWFNTTRMHVWTRLTAEQEGATGLGLYPDGMVVHDSHVGVLLDLLDELGITDDTIVIYSTDNGAEVFSWPDGGCTPFRNEKNSMYDGGYRVPMMARWPGRFPAGAECNGIISLLDWLPTLMAAAGRPNIKAQLLAGFLVGDRPAPWKACLDGYNLLPALTGAEDAAWPRSEYFYVNDSGDLVGVRFNQYKVMFRVNEKSGFPVWQETMLQLKLPYITSIRSDPFERYNFEPLAGWPQWYLEHAFVIFGASVMCSAFAASVREWPPHGADAGDVASVLTVGDTDGQESVGALSPADFAASPVVATFTGSADQLEALATWLRTCTVGD